jgi:hypothetical protein
MNEPLRLRYDQRSDVLYVSAAPHNGAYGEEGSPGLVWRYSDDDNSLVGVTVVDYATYWRPRLRLLVKEMASRFHIAEDSAKQALEQVND